MVDVLLLVADVRCDVYIESAKYNSQILLLAFRLYGKSMDVVILPKYYYFSNAYIG